jgi:hypothetical protein
MLQSPHWPRFWMARSRPIHRPSGWIWFQEQKCATRAGAFEGGGCTPYSVDSSPPPSPAPGEPRPTFCGFPRFGIDGLNRTLEGAGVSIAGLATSLSRTHRAHSPEARFPSLSRYQHRAFLVKVNFAPKVRVSCYAGGAYSSGGNVGKHNATNSRVTVRAPAIPSRTCPRAILSRPVVCQVNSRKVVPRDRSPMSPPGPSPAPAATPTPPAP